VFEDDLKRKRFLETFDAFFALYIDQYPDSQINPHDDVFLNKIANHDIVQLPNNHIPKGLVLAVKGKASNEEVDLNECNIGTEEDSKFVKLSSNLSREQRIEYDELLREFADVFAWTYEDLKTYDTSIIEHKIPLKEEAKPFR
jgi:hypothetical protein